MKCFFCSSKQRDVVEPHENRKAAQDASREKNTIAVNKYKNKRTERRKNESVRIPITKRSFKAADKNGIKTAFHADEVDTCDSSSNTVEHARLEGISRDKYDPCPSASDASVSVARASTTIASTTPDAKRDDVYNAGDEENQNSILMPRDADEGKEKMEQKDVKSISSSVVMSNGVNDKASGIEGGAEEGSISHDVSHEKAVNKLACERLDEILRNTAVKDSTKDGNSPFEAPTVAKSLDSVDKLSESEACCDSTMKSVGYNSESTPVSLNTASVNDEHIATWDIDRPNKGSPLVHALGLAISTNAFDTVRRSFESFECGQQDYPSDESHSQGGDSVSNIPSVSTVHRDPGPPSLNSSDRSFLEGYLPLTYDASVTVIASSLPKNIDFSQTESFRSEFSWMDTKDNPELLNLLHSDSIVTGTTTKEIEGNSSQGKYDDKTKELLAHPLRQVIDKHSTQEKDIAIPHSFHSTRDNSPSKKHRVELSFTEIIENVEVVPLYRTRSSGASTSTIDTQRTVTEVITDTRDEPPSREIQSGSDIIEGTRYNGWSSFGSLTPASFLILGTSENDIASQPHVLSPSLMESLQGFLPYSLTESNFWMKYSRLRDGASLKTLLDKVKGSKQTVIAIETEDGEVFGSFTSSPWRIGPRYFGTGESFLWRLKESRLYSAQRPVQKWKHVDNELEIYPYTNMNDFVQFCTSQKIAVGGGEWGDESCPYTDQHAGPGLLIEDDITYGTSGSCATFANPSLCKSSQGDKYFKIYNMEVWAFTPCLTEKNANIMEDRMSFIEKNRMQ